MKYLKVLYLTLISISLFNCTGNQLEEKGFSVQAGTENESTSKEKGIEADSVVFKTRPSSVLLTGNPDFRLTTVYKINYNKKNNKSFIGSNSFHKNYSDVGRRDGNQWNYNFMPGLEAVYGYNMVNVSHYNIKTQKQKNLFDSPVLIKTLYYPSFTKDTLNNTPVNRGFYMVSVYDEDTNGDGYINVRDLRRFYTFDIKAENKTPLVPKNYSVISSEYDSANDFMYVFAQQDANQNGKKDEGEDIHVFWIDLKNPGQTGRQY